MNSIENLKWRYAVKKFDKDKLLTETQIQTLKEAFNLTATSYGLQPVKMVVLQNKEIQQKLVPHSWNQQQIAQASHVLILCIPAKVEKDHIEKYFNLVKEVRDTPDDILNPFKEFLIGHFSKLTDEAIFKWNKNQAYIVLGNLMTVAANEKIDACPMEGFSPEKYDEILGLSSQNLKSILVLPVGFRAEDDYMKDLKKVRKKVTDTVIEIK
ncbi:NAD(P)H-dependent oxidoreductase [Tenacibaculum maritimum]|uniref:NAD(P)H-dependent oxidoreductase n=1 Tax=Tenacibaculum maritimum TaxID=107401 RepID=UPI003875E1E5